MARDRCSSLTAGARSSEIVMARIFITGSSTGLGLMAGQLLIEQRHQVVLHARGQARANEALANAPGAEAVVVGDLSACS